MVLVLVWVKLRIFFEHSMYIVYEYEWVLLAVLFIRSRADLSSSILIFFIEIDRSIDWIAIAYTVYDHFNKTKNQLTFYQHEQFSYPLSVSLWKHSLHLAQHIHVSLALQLVCMLLKILVHFYYIMVDKINNVLVLKLPKMREKY